MAFNTRQYSVCAAIVLLLSAAGFSGCQAAAPRDQVCFDRHCFTVEVVEEEDSRMRGLQFRPRLGKWEGMLFVFPASHPHAFWMKDTLIPLDIIWMDSSRRVVYISPNTPPCTKSPCPIYAPDQSALYVLEINAGTADDLGIETGAQAHFRLKSLP